MTHNITHAAVNYVPAAYCHYDERIRQPLKLVVASDHHNQPTTFTVEGTAYTYGYCATTAHDTSRAALIATNNQANTTPPIIKLIKSRGTDPSTPATIVANDFIGQIDFCGHDGTDYKVLNTIRSTSEAAVDSGALRFFTTDGGVNTEKATLHANGDLDITTGNLDLQSLSFSAGDQCTVYDTGTDAMTYVCTAFANTPVAGNIHYVVMGRMVVLQIEGVIDTGSTTGASACTSSTAISAVARPSTTLGFAINVEDTGAWTAAMGMVTISAAGIVTFYLDGSRAGFTSAAGACGWFHTGVCYTTI